MRVAAEHFRRCPHLFAEYLAKVVRPGISATQSYIIYAHCGVYQQINCFTQTVFVQIFFRSTIHSAGNGAEQSHPGYAEHGGDVIDIAFS